MTDKGTSTQTDETAEKAIRCDYVDVVRLSEDQPRFLLQPHLQGGPPALEVRLLLAHLLVARGPRQGAERHG